MITLRVPSKHHGVHDVLIDNEDYLLVTKYSWTVYKKLTNYYARGTINQKTVLMHRLIMDAPKGKSIDHINCNGLDNRKENLRFATNSQNQQNKRKHMPNATSKYKGINWIKRYKSWHAVIELGDKTYHLGNIKDEEKAARAYDRAARRLFGEFARLNFPDSESDAHEEALEENERKKRSHPTRKRGCV